MIEPGALAAARSTQNGRVAVLATEATVHSKAYPLALQRLDKRIRAFQRACPMFVPLIEEGWTHKSAGPLIVQDYLAPVARCGADTVICMAHSYVNDIIDYIKANPVK